MSKSEKLETLEMNQITSESLNHSDFKSSTIKETSMEMEKSETPILTPKLRVAHYNRSDLLI